MVPVKCMKKSGGMSIFTPKHPFGEVTIPPQRIGSALFGAYIQSSFYLSSWSNPAPPKEHHWAVLPPSTRQDAPVMNEALPDARNMIVWAISSGLPTRL